MKANNAMESAIMRLAAIADAELSGLPSPVRGVVPSWFIAPVKETKCYQRLLLIGHKDGCNIYLANQKKFWKG